MPSLLKYGKDAAIKTIIFKVKNMNNNTWKVDDKMVLSKM
jgi:hypothetical protein